MPQTRRPGNGNFLTVKGARENNLRNIDVKFPLGEFVCVTGISGSGKSSLINEILYKTLACELNGARSRAGKCDGVEAVSYTHLILAENDYFSMRESNRLPFYDFETGAMLRPYGRE